MDFDTNKFTLLTHDQVFGDDKLQIIKDIGPRCSATDFALLLGTYPSNTYYANFTNKPDLKNRACDWSTQSKDLYVDPMNMNNIFCVDAAGEKDRVFQSSRCMGLRPVLPYTSISELTTNSKLDPYASSISKVVEYGEYPQYAVDEKLAKELELEYSMNNLNVTDKKYRTDKEHVWDARTKGAFSPVDHEEYEYKGKKYVRIKSNCYPNGVVLSNGVKVKPGDYVWVEVSPIKWYVDEESKLLISRNCIVSGIRYCEDNYLGLTFEYSEMYKFLNEYFKYDIIPSRIMTLQEKSRREKRSNPYGFDFRLVSEEDIIKGAVESNVPVFLHGRSSEGKSARIKELDSDCEIIYMRNATPESLNGKSVYNQATGEMIDVKPSWLVKLEEKCEREPDKIHIVFFDELTNALPSIQGMAFNIVLDREVNGKWELPKNARIAAAGNDMNDSLAANQMAEPLFNRFAHVYINTKTEDWLKWAITPEEDYKRLDYKEEQPPLKIHPAIYAYICMNGDALRTEYNGETPNADPRKWEMASKVLYKTKNPQMLRALVGEDITREFVAFCNLQAISLEDVLNDNYSEVEIQELNTAERYSTTVGLSQAKEEDIEKVRKFVMKMGPEFGAIFDAIWTHGDERRLELIAEIKLGESEKENGGINNGR